MLHHFANIIDSPYTIQDGTGQSLHMASWRNEDSAIRRCLWWLAAGGAAVSSWNSFVWRCTGFCFHNTMFFLDGIVSCLSSKVTKCIRLEPILPPLGSSWLAINQQLCFPEKLHLRSQEERDPSRLLLLFNVRVLNPKSRRHSSLKSHEDAGCGRLHLNPSPVKAEADRSPWGWSQPGLHSEALLKKK